MVLELRDIWDFHTDLRVVLSDPPDSPHYAEQIDLPAAREMGGLFSATGRNPALPQKDQIALIEEQANLIKGAEGMTLARSAADLDGAGRQVLHAEGVYFIRKTEDLGLLDWLWETGFRSLAPTYNEDNALAGGATGNPDYGLTPLGRDFCLEAWRKGFILCCAHSNHRSKAEMAGLAHRRARPLSYSHGHLDDAHLPMYGERGLPRSLAPEIFATGGLVGLSPLAAMYGSFDRYREEIDFLAGIDPSKTVLATDFGGARTPLDGRYMFEEIEGIRGVPGFVNRLAERLGAEFAKSFAGETLKNFLRSNLGGGPPHEEGSR